MADRPIIFSAPMVRALLAGRKTQTRRVLKLQPIPFTIDEAGTPCDVGLLHVEGDALPRVTLGRVITMQEVRFAVVDRLWVRENWWSDSATGGHEHGYLADGELYAGNASVKRRSSMMMPRRLSRLTLTVTNVRVQRLQNISREDVIAEGITKRDGCPIEDVWAGWHEPYAKLWDDLHGEGAWTANPWVAAISFTVHRGNINAIKDAAGSVPSSPAADGAPKPRSADHG